MQERGQKNKLVYVVVDEEGVFFFGFGKAKDFRDVDTEDDELDRIADMYLREELEGCE